MTQEEKQLLLKDLCTRLLYGVKVRNVKSNFDINNFNHNTEEIKTLIEEYDIKPYLRPMSSMTSKEWMEYCDASVEDQRSWTWAGKEYKFTPVTNREEFLNSHHFDYRGLIPLGLALKAKEGMYSI